MRFAHKDAYHKNAVITDVTSISLPGYVASVSSQGARAEKRVAEFYGLRNGRLNDLRVISPEVDAHLQAIEAEIIRLREEHQNLLADNFLTFRLAEVGDFPAEIVHGRETKAQAEAQLPQGAARKEAVKRCRQLSGEVGQIFSRMAH